MSANLSPQYILEELNISPFRKDGRWPFVVDSSGRTSTFIKYTGAAVPRRNRGWFCWHEKTSCYFSIQLDVSLFNPGTFSIDVCLRILWEGDLPSFVVREDCAKGSCESIAGVYHRGIAGAFTGSPAIKGHHHCARMTRTNREAYQVFCPI